MHLERGGLEWDYLLEFVETARKTGVDEIGFTEHAYNFVEAAPLLRRPEYVAARSSGYRIDDYVKLIKKAQDTGLPVKLGIEMDYIPESEKEIAAFLAEYPWDFVIGSVHWIGDWPFDIDPNSWQGRDIAQVYHAYFALAEQAMRSGLFDVFAHPDIIRIFGHKLPEDHEDKLTVYLDRLAQVAHESNVCLEVSSAGLRKPLGEIYPHKALLQSARRLNVPITLASDAHEPEHVGWKFDLLVEYARSAGYRTITIFNRRRRSQQAMG